MAAFGPRLPGIPFALLKEEWDVIMATSFPCAYLLPFALFRPFLGIPLVIVGAFHDGDELQDTGLTWRLAARADAYGVHTEFERWRALDAGLKPEKVHLLPGGSDPDLIAGCDKAQARRHYGVSDTVFLYVGQFLAGKGLSTILDAAQQLWQQRQDFTLLLAGSSHSADAQRIIKQVDRLPTQLRGRIKLVNNFSHVEKPRLYSAADVFLFPSKIDSFGLAMIDAWAARLPVIAGDCAAQRSYIKPEHDALLTLPDEPRELARHMVRLMDDPGLRRELGTNGRRRVEKEYNWDMVTARYREVYQNLVWGRGKNG